MRSRRSSALMAPARRKAAAGARGRKLSAFLKDFDREGRPRAGAPRPGPERRGRARAASDAASVPAVRSRVEQLRTNGERLVKEMENLYDVELLRLPAALREMNWLEFFGTGEGRGRGRGRGGLPLKRRSEAVAEERWDAARGARASRTRVGAGGCAAPSARGRSLAAGTPAVRCPLLRRRYGAPACVAGAVPATCRSDASKGNIFFVAKGGSQKVVEEAVTVGIQHKWEPFPLALCVRVGDEPKALCIRRRGALLR